MPGLDPLATIKIRNRSGDADDPVAGIRVDAVFGAGGLEQIGRILVQGQVGVARHGGDLALHFGQSRSWSPVEFALRRLDYLDGYVGGRPFCPAPFYLGA